MSKTDKTRPWWVRLAEEPMVNCRPVHNHRFGPCTLPDEITAESASLSHRTGGCYWHATDRFVYDRGGVTGGREAHYLRREDRRRDRREARRQARRDLRAYHDVD